MAAMILKFSEVLQEKTLGYLRGKVIFLPKIQGTSEVVAKTVEDASMILEAIEKRGLHGLSGTEIRPLVGLIERDIVVENVIIDSGVETLERKNARERASRRREGLVEILAPCTGLVLGDDYLSLAQ